MAPKQSPFDDDVQVCPACGATVQNWATKCRQCGENLDGTRKPQPTARPPRPGPWRDGDLLVAKFESELPPRCVKTNEPVGGVVAQQFTWIPSWVIPTFFLCSPFVFYAISSATQTAFSLSVGYAPSVGATARRHTLIAVGIGIVSLLFVGYFVAMSMDVRNQTSGAWGVIGFLLFLFALGYWFFMVPALKVRKVRGDVAWIAGACPEFLAVLPEYPAGKA